MAPKVNVVTPAERELQRKYELLRKKKEARAAREAAKRDNRDGGDDGGARDDVGASARGRAGARAESSGAKRPSGDGRKLPGVSKVRPTVVAPRKPAVQKAEKEPVDPAIERAKAILAGLQKKKEPGVAALNAKAAAETAETDKQKQPKLVFTMSKRELKQTVAPVDDDGPIGYASTVGYASTEPKAPEPVEDAPEPTPEPAPESAPESAPKPTPDSAPDPVVEQKKDVKRPRVLKRPSLLSPDGAKKQRMSAPTPFPEITDGVGERTDKTEREVFVSNLPAGCTVEALSHACFKYGRVNSCRVIEHRNFGFVTFADASSAEKMVAVSIEHMNDPDKPPVLVDGRVVLVDYSENKGEHGGTGGKAHREEIRQRAVEELERIRDGEIVADEPETVKRDMLVYDDI